MNKLKVPLAAIGSSGTIVEITVSLGAITPVDVDALPPGSVTVRGEMSEAGHEYVFHGSVSGVFRLTCDRCLEAAEAVFESEVYWTYAEGTETDAAEAVVDAEEDESIRTFAGSEIDLTAGVWEEVVLAAPAKSLCRPDCAGLCPYCGANWNRERCNCHETEELDRKGLAGLASLLPKLKPGRPEE